MDRAVQRLMSEQPDLLVHVGDMVESARNIRSFEDYRKNWLTATAIMDKPDRPWFLTFGDHDVVPPRYEPMSSDDSREQWAHQPGASPGPSGRFAALVRVSIKGYHFIFLYSLENLHTDPRWNSIS